MTLRIGLGAGLLCLVAFAQAVETPLHIDPDTHPLAHDKGAAVAVDENRHRTHHVVIVPDPALTFESVLQATLERDPQYVLKSVYTRSAEQQQQAARQWLPARPALTLGYWGDNLNQNSGSREAEVGLEFDLWRLGERRNAADLGGNADRVAQAWWRSFRWQLAGQLQEILFQVSDTEVNYRFAEQSIEDARQLLQVAQKRERAGDLSHSDVMLVEAALVEAEQQRLQADGERADAMRLYITATGLEHYPSLFTTSAMPESLDLTVAHPYLGYLQQIREQSRLRHEQQRYQSQGSPTLSLGVRRERGAFNEPEIDSVGIGVRVPLGGASARSATLRAEGDLILAQSEAELLKAHRSLQLQIHEAEHQLEMVTQGRALAEKSLALSERQWKMSKMAFAAGETDLLPTLTALQRLHQSQLQFQLLTLRQQQLRTSYNHILGEMP